MAHAHPVMFPGPGGHWKSDGLCFQGYSRLVVGEMAEKRYVL